ncbi:hypothetical protein F5Y17DRAFT_425771 [Xylariaceae sp. FL0594]|nr:hypothetical protein F5Y17DRAFT_425771 [Xylariaceae sp. FL0594]
MDSSKSPSRDLRTTATEEERARLRRNQRNSRARKKAYIQDLEKRWNACVQLGVQATIEMQKEARRVREENRLLRALLHKQGIDDLAIQEAVASLRQTQDKDVHPTAAGADLRPRGNTRPDNVRRSRTEDPSLVDCPDILEDEANVSQEFEVDDWLTEFCNVQDTLSHDILI